MNNILIIDDEPALCQLMKTYLEKSGRYHVDTVTTGAEGIQKASEFDYNTIILDVLMPDLSGYETLKRIRTLPGTRGQIPVIAISARASLKEVFHMARIHSFLVKPFQTEHLKGILGSICEGAENTAVGTTAFAAPVKETVQSNKVLVAGMEKFIISKVQTYLKQMGYDVVTCLDDSDALNFAVEDKPRMIFYQYWDDAEKFNAVKLYRETLKHPEIENIPCRVLCPKNLEIEASKEFPKEKLLTYQDSRDLLNKLRDCLPK